MLDNLIFLNTPQPITLCIVLPLPAEEYSHTFNLLTFNQFYYTMIL